MQQIGNFGQLLDVGQIAHIAHQNGLHIAVKPGSAPMLAGARYRIRKTTCQQSGDELIALTWWHGQS